MVCQKHEEVITFDTMDALVEEASRLINDEVYRKSRGRAMRDCVIGVEEFNRNFQESITTVQSQYPMDIDENVELHYLNVEDKLKLENKTKGYQRSVFTTLGTTGLFVCPGIWMDGVVARTKSIRFI